VTKSNMTDLRAQNADTRCTWDPTLAFATSDCVRKWGCHRSAAVGEGWLAERYGPPKKPGEGLAAKIPQRCLLNLSTFLVGFARRSPDAYSLLGGFGVLFVSSASLTFQRGLCGTSSKSFSLYRNAWPHRPEFGRGVSTKIFLWRVFAIAP